MTMPFKRKLTLADAQDAGALVIVIIGSAWLGMLPWWQFFTPGYWDQWGAGFMIFPIIIPIFLILGGVGMSSLFNKRRKAGETPPQNLARLDAPQATKELWSRHRLRYLIGFVLIGLGVLLSTRGSQLNIPMIVCIIAGPGAFIIGIGLAWSLLQAMNPHFRAREKAMDTHPMRIVAQLGLGFGLTLLLTPLCFFGFIVGVIFLIAVGRDPSLGVQMIREAPGNLFLVGFISFSLLCVIVLPPLFVWYKLFRLRGAGKILLGLREMAHRPKKRILTVLFIASGILLSLILFGRLAGTVHQQVYDCAALPAPDRTFCWKSYAKRTGDVQYCDKIEEGEWKKICKRELGVIKEKSISVAQEETEESIAPFDGCLDLEAYQGERWFPAWKKSVGYLGRSLSEDSVLEMCASDQYIIVLLNDGVGKDILRYDREKDILSLAGRLSEISGTSFGKRNSTLIPIVRDSCTADEYDVLKNVIRHVSDCPN